MGRIKDTSKLKSFSERAFGVEIEFVAPTSSRREIAREVRNIANSYLPEDNQVLIVSEGYNHDTRDYWKLVSDCTADATISQERRGLHGCHELVSPILKGEKSVQQLEMIMKAMVEYGCEVSRHCGLHIHHDVTSWRQDLRSSNYKKNELTMSRMSNLITLTQKFEGAIYGMLPNSRSNSQYCRPINECYGSVWQAISGKSTYTKTDKVKAMKRHIKESYSSKDHALVNRVQGNRYCGLNLKSFLKHGTIEYRYGAPTLNFTKMINWIVFTQQFVNMAETWKSVQTPAEMLIDTKANCDLTFDKMRDSLGLAKRLCRDDRQRACGLWIRKRFNHFHSVDADGSVTSNA